MSQLYRTMNAYLRERYGQRVQKVSLDAGFTCPNRDGTKAVGGCIYCNNDSFNFSAPVSVRDQLREGIERMRHRYGARKFIAYFQAYTNTYGPPDFLYDTYSTINDFPDIVGLSIGTRPDCLAEEVLQVIERFVSTHEVWLELGLESSNEETLKKINRAHTFADFRDAVLRASGRGFKIASHIITGFPWESEEVMIQTGRDVAALPIDAIKIHNLHIVKGTALERMHERQPLHLFSMQEYASVVARILEILPPQMIIQRLTADCPTDLLIAPEWTNQKKEIIAAIDRELAARRATSSE